MSSSRRFSPRERLNRLPPATSASSSAFLRAACPRAASPLHFAGIGNPHRRQEVGAIAGRRNDHQSAGGESVVDLDFLLNFLDNLSAELR